MNRHLLLTVLSLVGLLGAWAWPESASDDAAARLQNSATVLQQVSSDPTKGIPETVLARAKCIVVVPNLIKAGLVVGGKYGHGVAVCRRNADNESAMKANDHHIKKASEPVWSAPAFITIGGGTFGPQIGAEGIDLVLMVMNDKGMQELLSNKVQFSEEGSVAAGRSSSGAAVGSTSDLDAEMLIFKHAKGVFAGQALEGAALQPDTDAIKAFYGSDIPFDKILEGQAAPPPSAEPFMQAVESITRQAAQQQARQQMPEDSKRTN